MTRASLKGPRHRLLEIVARQMARRFGSTIRLSVEDLYDLGVPGLARAHADWDGRGNFDPFAMQRIRWAIVDGLRKRSRDDLTMATAAAELSAEQTPRTLDDLRGATFDLKGAAEETLDEVVDMGGANLAMDLEGADAVEDDVNRIRLLRAISALPPPEDLIMERYTYHGDTFEEVGKAVGMSSAAACKIYAKAVRTLRRQLGDPAERPGSAHPVA